MPRYNPQTMRHYKGNPNLKCAGVQMAYTTDQIAERIKCTNDPLYFIQTYMKIVHVDRGLVSFDLYDFQKTLLQAYIDERFVIAKLPRQVGKSTVTIAYIMWTVLFGPMQNIAVLANKAQIARDILAKLQLAFEHIPLWMQQGIVSWNRGSIELENGSKVVAASTAKSSIRGNTYNIIFLDEFAFVPQNIANEFITSVYPTISSGTTTKLFMVSTPNGMNLFYDYWEAALAKENLYKPIEAHWSVVPGRDAKWAEDQIKQLGQEKFNQEFNCEFLGSVNTLIVPSKMMSLGTRKREPLHKINDIDIYEFPQEKHIYMTIVDTAEGQNLDYSAMTVIDVTEAPYRVVAKYRNNKVSPMMLPNIIYNVATKYNTSHVLIETNNIGSQVAETLHSDLEYENIFSTTNMGRGGQRISAGFKKNAKLGVKTTAPIKSLGCSNLKSIIENDQLLIHDKDTIKELAAFVATKKSFAAGAGHNDDLVMCLVLFGWLATQPVFKELTDVDIRKNMADQKEESMREEMLPFGIIASSEDHVKAVETFKDNDGTNWEVVNEWEESKRSWNEFDYTGKDDQDESFEDW